MINKPTYIYALKDPRSDLVRYIGKTMNTPKTRFGEHIRRSKLNVTHKDKWIQLLLKIELNPILEIIDKVEDGIEAEIAYIKLFKGMGADLCNHTLGGDGIPGHRHTQEWKNALSIRCKNNPPMLNVSLEKRKQLGILHSQYLKDNPDKCYFNTINFNKELRKEIIVKANKASTLVTSKKLFIVDKDKNILQEFSSVGEAGRILNLNSSVIAANARKNTKDGIRLSYKGFLFTYEVNNKVLVKEYNKGASKSIIVLDNNLNEVEYLSIKDFCKIMNFNTYDESCIRKLVNSGISYKGYLIKLNK